MRSSHSGPVASRAIGRTGIRSVVWERLRTLRDIAPRAAALLGCVGREALLVVYGGGGTPNGRLACPPLFVSRPASELLAQTLSPTLVGVAKPVCARIRPAARALESLRSPFRRIRLRGRPGRRQGLGALRTTHCKRYMFERCNGTCGEIQSGWSETIYGALSGHACPRSSDRADSIFRFVFCLTITMRERESKQFNSDSDCRTHSRARYVLMNASNLFLVSRIRDRCAEEYILRVGELEFC